MKPAALPPDEAARLHALMQCNLLDTLPEPGFDDLAELAAFALGTPIGLVSLVDRDRQWFKARRGLDAAETSRDVAFCAHAILGDGPFVSEDALADERFADNPLVTAGPKIRFYMGVPIRTPSGQPIGTVCVIDTVPRSPTAAQVAALVSIARQAGAQIALRLELGQRDELEASLAAARQRLQQMIDHSLMLVQSVDDKGRFVYTNRTWRETLGYELAEEVTGSVFDIIAPESLAHCREVFGQLRPGAQIRSMPLVFLARDGRRVWVEGNIACLGDGGGPVTNGFFLDVTRQREADAALQRQTAELRQQALLLDLAPVAIVVRDHETDQIRFWNRGAERIYGFTQQEAMGQVLPTLLASEGVAQTAAALAEVGQWHGELVQRNKAGHPVYVAASCVVQRDAAGGAAGVLETHADISTRVAAERHARMFSGIVDHMPIGVYVYRLEDLDDDATLRLIGMNGAAATITGLPTDAVLGAPIDLNFPGLRAAGLPQAYAGVVRSGEPFARDDITYGDDRIATSAYSIQAFALPDQCVGVAFEDTTARKPAEHLRKRLAAVVDATTDLVATVDPNGKLLSLNRAGRRLLGIGDDEALAGVDPLVFLPAAALEAVLTHAAPAAVEHGSWAGELDLLTRDGRTVPLSTVVLAHAEPGAVGPPICFSTVARNVSERREVDRLKAEFVSTVSHELRTPLTSIRSSLRLLEKGVVGQLPDSAAELIAMARSNTERLIRLINDILDLEKMDAGRLELNLKLVAPQDVAKRSVQSVLGLAADAGVRVHCTAACGPILVSGDADRLVQVLTNLLGNAVKFSSAGDEVVLRLDARVGRLRVEVTDRGRGIAPADQARLFGRFQQLDASDSRGHAGTGLGLAIAKSIVEQHGGQIGVDSAVGLGSTFWFELPALANAADRLERRFQVALVVDKPVRPALFAEQIAELTAARTPVETAGALQVSAIKAMINEYTEALPSKMAAIARAVDRARLHLDPAAWAEAHLLSHQLHGSAESYGFPDVGAAACEVERLLEPVALPETADEWAAIGAALGCLEERVVASQRRMRRS